jgi:hypothetical protein
VGQGVEEWLHRPVIPDLPELLRRPIPDRLLCQPQDRIEPMEFVQAQDPDEGADRRLSPDGPQALRGETARIRN